VAVCLSSVNHTKDTTICGNANLDLAAFANNKRNILHHIEYDVVKLLVDSNTDQIIH
jgi:hypothetical protein